MSTNSMQLKQINVELVKSVLKQEKYSTKTSIALATKLSIATCGNILKELLATDEVQEVDFCPSTGGRPARRFIYNKDYAYVAILYARREGLYRTLTCVISNLIGEQIYEDTIEYDDISVDTFDQTIDILLERYPNIKVLGIGVPGVVHEGNIDICDFKMLSHTPMAKHLAEKYGLKVIVENDVNSTVLGFYHKHHYTIDENIAYLYYPIDDNPGAGIMINGRILRGQSHFAGEISFLPLGVEVDYRNIQDNIELLSHTVAKTIQSINCIINPKSVIISGYCFSDYILESIKKQLSHGSLYWHIPEILYDEDISENYIYGLTTMALEQLSCNIQIIEK